MIADALLPALVERFADRGLRAGTSPDEIAVFPAAHPEVGNVTIWDHGDEATVGIGEITHGHFNPYDDSLTSEQRASRITEDVIDFLQDLFDDRVLLWKSRDRRAGGWRRLERDADISVMDGNALAYLWSGPINKPDDHRGV